MVLSSCDLAHFRCNSGSLGTVLSIETACVVVRIPLATRPTVPSIICCFTLDFPSSGSFKSPLSSFAIAVVCRKTATVCACVGAGGAACAPGWPGCACAGCGADSAPDVSALPPGWGDGGVSEVSALGISRTWQRSLQQSAVDARRTDRP